MTASARARLVPALLAAALLALPATQAFAGNPPPPKMNKPVYSYVGVPVPLGADYVDPSSINQHSLIVGDAYSGTHGAAFELAGYTFVLLKNPTSSTFFNKLSGIADNGMIVGDVFDNSGGAGFEIGHQGYVKLLKPTSKTTYIQPTAISDQGVVVGNYYEGTKPFAFQVKTDGDGDANDGKYTILPNPTPSTNFVQPTGVNSDGKIVGLYYDNAGAHGFILTKKGYLDLPLPTPATTYVQPEGINDRGQIVGLYYEGSVPHGFAYTNHGYYNLNPATMNTLYIDPHDINDDGAIVGLFYSASNAQGFIANTHPIKIADGHTNLDTENMDWDNFNRGKQDWNWKWDWHW